MLNRAQIAASRRLLTNLTGEGNTANHCGPYASVAMQTVAATALQDSERIETSFEDLAKAFGGKDCAPLGDLIYSIGVEVVPTITWTGDYRKLKITVTSPGDDETDALEAESIFTQQLRSLGTMRVVTGRGLTIGDQVVMDLDAVNAATVGTRTPKT